MSTSKDNDKEQPNDHIYQKYVRQAIIVFEGLHVILRSLPPGVIDARS